MISFFSHKGQSLLELVVSIGLLIIVVTALAITTINGLRNSQLSQNQSQATKIAQEGIDGVKSIRARNCVVSAAGGSYYWYNIATGGTNSIWSNLTFDTSGRNFQPVINSSTCQLTEANSEQIDSKFVRVININKTVSGDLLVNSTVSWNDNTGDHRSSISTLLTNY